MPTLNCRELTRKAIASCVAQDIPISLMIIDSASDDGTFEMLRAYSVSPSGYATLLNSVPRDLGVSKAWNAGLKFLFGIQQAPAVLVINSDVELRPDTYRQLLADGSQFVTAVGSSTNGTQFPGGEPTGARRPHPDFSCFLIRRECWEKVGPFDEAMKIYCSDGDYHLRMHRAGIEACCIDLPFLHHASATIKHAEGEERERILKQAGEDRMVFKMKWGVEMGSKEYYELFGHGSPEEGR